MTKITDTGKVLVILISPRYLPNKALPRKLWIFKMYSRTRYFQIFLIKYLNFVRKLRLPVSPSSYKDYWIMNGRNNVKETQINKWFNLVFVLCLHICILSTYFLANATSTDPRWTSLYVPRLSKKSRNSLSLFWVSVTS